MTHTKLPLILAEQDGGDFYFLDPRWPDNTQVWAADFHVAEHDLSAARQARIDFQGFCASTFGVYADFGDHQRW